MKILVKNAAGDQVQMEELRALAKGLIDAKDLSNGGDLTAQQSSKLISLIKKNDFLSKIQTIPMRKLMRNVDVVDIMRRQLKRVPEGQKPGADDLATADEFGSVLTALPVQLFPSFTLGWLRDNQDNPNLLTELESGFATSIGNDLVDLGWNGVADDYEGKEFIRLNKGWLQIARESDDAKKVVIDPAMDGYQASMRKILDAADYRSKRDGVFLMNDISADAYWREISAHITGTPLAAESPLRRFEGKTIEVQEDIPDNVIAFTPLKNLAHGIHTNIQRSKGYENRARALEFTFDFAIDYEIAAKQLFTMGEAA